MANLGVLILLFLFWQAPAANETQAAEPLGSASSQSSQPVDAELAEKLLKAKRIYVENFGDDVLNKTLQAMVIDALRITKRFIITENKEKTDLVLRGSALEKTSQAFHSSDSGTAVAAARGAGLGGFAGGGAAIKDSQASTETVNEVRMAVRLVSTDGDVIWSTTQESTGAKYKSASADVADKIAKQLLRDIEKLTKNADKK
ncbi:MAG: hypothetical protein HY644_04180 [Acidobacteria bacterium]|nr:hypothetical protein [Acidobacteriota bacterium]